MPVLTPARKESFDSEKRKMGGFITQEVVDQVGQNLGVVRLDIGDSLQAYWITFNWETRLFSFIINQKHEFVYHPKKKAVYSSSQEMQAMQPYIAVKDGYAKGGQSLSIRLIPDSDWTLIGGLHLKDFRCFSRSSCILSLV